MPASAAPSGSRGAAGCNCEQWDKHCILIHKTAPPHSFSQIISTNEQKQVTQTSWHRVPDVLHSANQPLWTPPLGAAPIRAPGEGTQEGHRDYKMWQNRRK